LSKIKLSNITTAMTKPFEGRMLLSHNFNLTDERVPMLSREAFAAIFTEGLAGMSIECQPIDHPHWIVEVCFGTDLSAEQAGAQCAQVLLEARQIQQPHPDRFPIILMLGGLKTTPATGPLPALQPGEWGVDVVETASAELFLREIGWTETVATRSPDTVFKVVL
jgi:Protein of unknown function (DUF2656)